MKIKSLTSKHSLSEWLLPLLVAVFVFICIRFAEDLPKGSNYWQGKTMKFVFIDFGGVIVICYFLSYVLDRWLALNMRKHLGPWLEYGLLVIGVFLLCLAEMYVTWSMNDRMYDLADIAVPTTVGVLFVSLFYGYKRGKYIKQENDQLRVTQEQMKEEQLQTELKLLRAQFHPHFLFNVLNTVYFQIDENNPEPRHTVELLSDLLRYQIYNEGNPVDINSEVDYLQKYMSLWKMRCSDKLKLTFDIDKEVLTRKVQPMLFLPLVENAFKYNGGAYSINILLTQQDGNIIFRIENSTPVVIPVKKKSGVGLENLRRRLSILYPNKHRLITEQRENSFFAELTIMP